LRKKGTEEAGIAEMTDYPPAPESQADGARGPDGPKYFDEAADPRGGFPRIASTENVAPCPFVERGGGRRFL
jgi:hypothetical protein